jgi:hypothetical protein
MMKPLSFFLLPLFILCSTECLYAQAKGDSPVEHMRYLSEHEEALSKKYMSYMSEVAHGGKARKMEKRREDVVAAIREALRESNKLRPYKGDASLRDAYRSYWNVLLSIFNEDYHKIVDMEEVAERSYDAMEAVLMIQDKVDEKQHEAFEMVRAAYNTFAGNHGVTLTEGQTSKLDRKLKLVSDVNKYYRQIFLIYFKSTVQESQMIEALNQKDVAKMEQFKNSVLKFAEEGLVKLDSVKPYKGDGSMITACRKVLEFQKSEAGGKIDVLIDFLLKSEELEKTKKAFESTPANKRSKQDIDAFNQAVSNYNKSVAEYNKVNNELNASRTRVMTNYDVTRKKFMDHHVPRA